MLTLGAGNGRGMSGARQRSESTQVSRIWQSGVRGIESAPAG